MSIVPYPDVMTTINTCHHYKDEIKVTRGRRVKIEDWDVIGQQNAIIYSLSLSAKKPKYIHRSRRIYIPRWLRKRLKAEGRLVDARVKRR